MRLIFVRHGQTDWNFSKQFCGHSDIEMNKIGVRQIENTAARLREELVDYIYSSDLRRATKSAEIIRDVLCKYNDDYYPDGPLEIITKPELREMNFGNWESLTYEQILKKDVELGKKWSEDSFNTQCPNGESLVQCYERCNKAIDEIRENTVGEDKTVLIVTHAGVIQNFLSKALVDDYNAYWHWKVLNGGIIKVEYNYGFCTLEVLNG